MGAYAWSDLVRDTGTLDKLIIPRRYSCCGSLLLLVLDVCIYTLVQLLC